MNTYGSSEHGLLRSWSKERWFKDAIAGLMAVLFRHMRLHQRVLLAQDPNFLSYDKENKKLFL
jgi:hypothetical protein